MADKSPQVAKRVLQKHNPAQGGLAQGMDSALGQRINSAMTVGRYFELWLGVFVAPNRAFSTHRQYRQVWRNYLKAELEHVALGELTSFECQSALNALLTRLSARSVELARSILVKALSDAVRQGLLASNPASATFRPKVRPGRLRALRPGECLALIESLRPDPHDSVIKFLLGTGLRISEALGLRWEDFGPDRAVIKIESRLEWLPGGNWRLAPLKTRKSRRSLPVSPLARQVLDQLNPEAPRNEGFVFASSSGTPLWPRNVQRSLDAALKRAHLSHVSLHDLRRSFASTLAASGTPVHILQALLGHESVTTTLNHYASHFQADLELALSTIPYG